MLPISTSSASEDEAAFLHALLPDGAAAEELLQPVEFLFVRAFQRKQGLNPADGFRRQPFPGQFCQNGFRAYLVELVDCHGDVGDSLGLADDFGNSAEDFPVVELDADAHAEARENGVYDLHQFHFIHQRVAAHYVGVALVEFAIAPLLRAVGAPYGLDLVALEGENQLLAVHDHVAREGNGQVVAQAFLAEFGGQARRIARKQLLVGEILEVRRSAGVSGRSVWTFREERCLFSAKVLHLSGKSAACFPQKRLHFFAEALRLPALRGGCKSTKSRRNGQPAGRVF